MNMRVVALLIVSLYICCTQTSVGSTKTTGCMKVCARNYSPVCGNNGKCEHEERNSCKMHNYNCKRADIKKSEFNDIRPGVCLKANQCGPKDR